MTEDGFRKLLLSLLGTEERAHMEHPDFRVDGRIFASLPAPGRGMLKLPPALQRECVSADPGVFRRAAGAWGRAGCTYIELRAAKPAVLRRLAREAWKAVRIAASGARPAGRRAR